MSIAAAKSGKILAAGKAFNAPQGSPIGCYHLHSQLFLSGQGFHSVPNATEPINAIVQQTTLTDS